MNARRHRVAAIAVALAVGGGLALYAYHRATDPRPTLERQREEAIVLLARDRLRGYVGDGPTLEIVDPLAKNRAAGKVYIYPDGDGWQVSGHYRRQARGHWRPWLMSLDADGGLRSLKLMDDDARVLDRARDDPRLHVEPLP